MQVVFSYVSLILFFQLSNFATGMIKGIVTIQSYLDYPDSVGQTHFLVCLCNPNCLDNKNDVNTVCCKSKLVL